MKILLLGFEYLDTEFLVNDDRLTSFRRLMEIGCYGKLSQQAENFYGKQWLSLLTGSPTISPENTTWEEGMQIQNHQKGTVGEDLSMLWEGLLVEGKKAFIVTSPEFSINEQSKLFHIPLNNNIPNVSTNPDSNSLYENNKSRGTSSKIINHIEDIISSAEWDLLISIDNGLSQFQSIDFGSTEAYQEAIHYYYHFLDECLGQLLDTLNHDTSLMIVSLRSDILHIQGQGDLDSSNEEHNFFILVAANNPIIGEIENVQIIDIAPSLLHLAGYDIPSNMQGKPIFTPEAADDSDNSMLSKKEQEILRERLSGLGYF